MSMSSAHWNVVAERQVGRLVTRLIRELAREGRAIVAQETDAQRPPASSPGEPPQGDSTFLNQGPSARPAPGEHRAEFGTLAPLAKALEREMDRPVFRPACFELARRFVDVAHRLKLPDR